MSLTWRFLGITALLVIVGLVFVFEASVAEAFNMVGDPYFFLKQQVVRAGIGVVALALATQVPLKWWRTISPIAFGLSVVLLLAVFVPGIGLHLNGARRWISLGGAVFQPVEFMKLSLIMFFATWLTQHRRVLPWLFLTGVPAALVILQPDLGSLLVLVGISFALYFVAGGQLKYIMGIVAAGLVLVSLAIIASPYRLARVTTYLNPESDPLGAGFHIRQITLALGNGHWFGQGLGNSRQKYAYIPEASTDSIFAIIAEEVGFIGSLALISLFGLYLATGVRIIKGTEPGSFEYLLAVGLLLWIAFQTVLNLAAVVALVPLTGVPLPFFSYGGSSLVMVLLATGILIAIRRQTLPATKSAKPSKK